MKFLLAGAVLMQGIAVQAAPLAVEKKPVSSQSVVIGTSLGGELAPGSSKVLSLAMPAGYVIQGTVTGNNVALDLVDDKGNHLRRLGTGNGSEQYFMWVSTGHHESLRLIGEGPDNGSFQLTFARSFTPAPRTASSTTPSANDGQSAEQSVEPVSPRLLALRRTLANGGNTDAFWETTRQQGSPLIEPVDAQTSLVTFLWRGAQYNVQMFGGPTHDHASLTRLDGSDVWWRSFVVPNTARASYQLAPDVPVVQGTAMENRRMILATAQRDPWNPQAFPPTPETAVDIYQGDSVLELPDAPAQPWVQARAGVQKGTLVRERFASKVLGNTRTIWTYVPAGRPPQALLVLFDADPYLHRVPTPTIIDNLIADGLIPPTAVVLIDNASATARGKELPPNEAFAKFLDQELMPHISARGLGQPAARTVIAGSSYGGLASSYAGLVNAKWFGNVLSLSGSYWWGPAGEEARWLTRQYAQAPKQKVNFYLDAGRYETGNEGIAGILETSREFGDTLRAKGYTVTQVEHDTGHDYLHWQGSLGCGLVALLNPERWPGLTACQGNTPAS